MIPAPGAAWGEDVLAARETLPQPPHPGEVRTGRHAADAMGFAYEGTFRAHMVVRGRRRDTAWFSLLAADR